MILIEYKGKGSDKAKLIEIDPICTWDDVAVLLQSGKDKAICTDICKAIVTMDNVLLHVALVRKMLGKYYRYATADQIVDLANGVGLPNMENLPSLDLSGRLSVSPRFDKETLRTLMDMSTQLEKYLEGKDKAMDGLCNVLAPDMNHTLLIKATCLAYCLGSISFIKKTYASTLYRATDNDDDMDDTALHFGWYETAISIGMDGLYGTVEDVLDHRFHSLAIHLVLQQQKADRMRGNIKK